MQSREFLINTVDKVKKFNWLASECVENVDISRGRYVVDAASILGIFSLDLSWPVTVTIHTDDLDRADRFFSEVEETLRG